MPREASRETENAKTRWGARLLVVSFGGATILSTVGFLDFQARAGAETSLSNAIYSAVKLFVLESPDFTGSLSWKLEAGRWLAAATTSLAVLGVARQLIRDELAAWRLKHLKNHVIVCGGGRQGSAAAGELLSEGNEVVVIDHASSLDPGCAFRRPAAHRVVGDPSKPEVLTWAGSEERG